VPPISFLSDRIGKQSVSRRMVEPAAAGRQPSRAPFDSTQSLHVAWLQFGPRPGKWLFMNKRIVVPLWLLLGLCLTGIGVAGEAKPEAIAQGEALLWLGLVDTNKYDESWQEMSPAFKKEVSKRKWKSTVTEIRKPLGKVVARKPKSADYTKELPGAPEGEYVVAKFETNFEKKTAAVETVTLGLGRDLIWRVSSYSVK